MVGVAEHSPSASQREMHSHEHDQLMYSIKGAIHVITTTGRWILPPTRAIWISSGTAHAFEARRPVDLNILYIDSQAPGSPRWDDCAVVNVTPLVRELITACVDLPWNHRQDSRVGRLARVLLEQLDVLPQAPLTLPEPEDPRAIRLAQWLRMHPEDRRPLTVLAPECGGSVKTLERLFAKETGISFGAWRIRLRMIKALEQLAYGENVANTAHAIGYESPSSFIAAFRNTFGTTPARYFDVHSAQGMQPQT